MLFGAISIVCGMGSYPGWSEFVGEHELQGVG